MKKHLLFTLFALVLTGSLSAKEIAPAAAAKPKPQLATPAATAPAVAPAKPVEATPAPAKSAFASDAEKAGYALGLNLATNWKRQGLESDLVDLNALARGLKDAQPGGKPLLTEEETRATLMALQQSVMAKHKLMAEKTKTDGEKFLADNKSKPGVVALTNGLQYKILTEGNGDSPKASDTVTVNYRGTLIDGTEFDSSAKHGGQPATFPVGGVIPGWTQALQLMKPGAKWQLFVPSELGYGERGTPGIPPNSTLIFEVELLSVSTPPPPAQVAAPQPITSDIIRVPSADEMKHGAKIETIKADQIAKLTNAPAKK